MLTSGKGATRLAIDIRQWLEELGLGKYVGVFVENEIDLDAAHYLSDDDLKELGLPMGPRRKIAAAIGKLRDLENHRDNIPSSATSPTDGQGERRQGAVPAHLAEQALRGKAAIEGERKQVTILFADLKSSTEFIESLDAEDADRLLRLAVDGMMGAVHRFEGTVNKVLGDGIMAIFGAPLAHEDHAMRACYTALAMQADMRAIAEDARHRFGVEVQVRIGINSGDVIVRAIHNDLTMDYDAIGPTVHLAARMEQMAIPGTTRLTVMTQRLAEGFIETTPLGPIPIKGVSEPIDVFELAGAVEVRSRFHANVRRGLSLFVGRDSEINSLIEALERAKAGAGQAVSVVGEAGVGKSRLYYEFLQLPMLADWLVLESGSVSHMRAAAFHPLVDLLRNYFGLTRSADARSINERVIGKLMAMDEALRAITTPILSLFGVPLDDADWQALDPAIKRRRTLDACRTLLLHEAHIQPLVIVFEDLHWIDPETQAFLELFIDSIAGAPILVLFNYRPEYDDPWLGKSYFTHLRVAPLERLGGDELLADLLGDDPAFDPLRAAILARTEGNPFFIEESVRSLVENGALTGKRGAYTLAIPVRSISVPASVQTVLAARVDRLEPELKRLLQTAAVIGKDFGHALLDQVSEVDAGDLNGHLVNLQAAEFLYETRLFPEQEYTFKHALTHQVTYEGMLHNRRRELHRAILDAMEAFSHDHRTEGLERLAYHAMRGEYWDKAYAHARDAGHSAVALNANRSALESFETAAEALARLPESDQHLAAAISLRFDLRDVLFVLGEPDAILAHLDAAESFAVKLKDDRYVIEVLLYKSGYYWADGDQLDQAIPLARRAYDLAKSLNDPELTGFACYRLATAHGSVGNYRESAEFAEEGLALLEPQAKTLFRFGGLVYGFIGSFCAMANAELGEFQRADEIGRRCYDLAVAAGHAYSITVTCFGIAHSYLLQDRIDEALPILDYGLVQIETHDARAAAPWVAGRAVYALVRAGRSGEIEGLTNLIRDSANLSQSMRHGFAFTWAARGYLELDQLDKAEALTSAVFEEFKNDPEKGVLAWGHWILAEIAQRRGQHDAARTAVQKARAIAEELSMAPLLALCGTR